MAVWMLTAGAVGPGWVLLPEWVPRPCWAGVELAGIAGQILGEALPSGVFVFVRLGTLCTVSAFDICGCAGGFALIHAAGVCWGAVVSEVLFLGASGVVALDRVFAAEVPRGETLDFSTKMPPTTSYSTWDFWAGLVSGRAGVVWGLVVVLRVVILD